VQGKGEIFMYGQFIRIPMQFFAEDGAGGADTQETNTPSDNAGGAEFTLEDVFRRFSAEDILGNEAMSKALQSRTDAIVTKALNTAKSKWEKEKLEEQDESKKLEKMTAAEREKYQFGKEKAEFEKQKAQFEHSQLEISVGGELQKRGLSADFAKYLTADNAENSKANIDAFEKLFNDAVSGAVNTRLKGGVPPKDPSAGTGAKGEPATLADALRMRNAGK